MPKTARRPSLGRGVMYLVLIVGSLVMAYPLIFGLTASFCTVEEFNRSGLICIPSELHLDNYAILATQAGAQIWLWLFNTVLRVAWYIVVPGVVAIMGGYVFARLRFRGRDVIFVALLASMMFPPIVYLIPTYLIFARAPLAGGNDIVGQGGTGFVDAWPALLLGSLVNGFFIFLFRQSYFSIPRDFEDAARVDGAGLLRIFWHVYLPMLAPSIAVMVIFQTVSVWNDYLWPLVMASGNESIWPMGLGFQQLMFSGASVKGQTGPEQAVLDYPFAFALATLAIVPMVFLFLRMQRHFIHGMAGFAVK